MIKEIDNDFLDKDSGFFWRISDPRPLYLPKVRIFFIQAAEHPLKDLLVTPAKVKRKKLDQLALTNSEKPCFVLEYVFDSVRSALDGGISAHFKTVFLANGVIEYFSI